MASLNLTLLQQQSAFSTTQKKRKQCSYHFRLILQFIQKLFITKIILISPTSYVTVYTVYQDLLPDRRSYIVLHQRRFVQVAIKVNLLDTDSKFCRLLTVIETSASGSEPIFKKPKSGLIQLIREVTVQAAHQSQTSKTLTSS